MVTSITYRLYPITSVVSGMILHPIARGREALRFYRDFVKSGLPDELIVYAAAVTTPDGMPVIAFILAYSGDDLAEGERILAPLREFGLPLPTCPHACRIPPCSRCSTPLSALEFEATGSPLSGRTFPTRRSVLLSQFARRCHFAAHFAFSNMRMERSARVAQEVTAFPTSRGMFDLVVLSVLERSGRGCANIAWTRRFFSAMQPWAAGSVYVNALEQDDSSGSRGISGQTLTAFVRSRRSTIREIDSGGIKIFRRWSAAPPAKPLNALGATLRS